MKNVKFLVHRSILILFLIFILIWNKEYNFSYDLQKHKDLLNIQGLQRHAPCSLTLNNQRRILMLKHFLFTFKQTVLRERPVQLNAVNNEPLSFQVNEPLVNKITARFSEKYWVWNRVHLAS
jgi:hypothetical protein